jgi:16S rRNA (cytidine1402-2'-O)-methyltransferase
MDQPKLYIIATPLGNREDITMRGLAILRSLGRFCAEDTREFRKLLNILGIRADDKVIASYGDHNEERACARAMEWLESGKNVGFVSDRGTPGISDPGARLVDAAWKKGFGVIPIPGPSAVTCLFSVAGFSHGRFVFIGFLPEKKSDRDHWVSELRQLGLPFCLYESPRRVRETVTWLAKEFPKGEVVLGREMTKFFEEYRRLPLSEVDQAEWPEMGEYTLFIDPGKPEVVIDTAGWEKEIDHRVLADKAWSKTIAEKYGVTASEVYNALQKKKPSRAE